MCINGIRQYITSNQKKNIWWILSALTVIYYPITKKNPVIVFRFVFFFKIMTNECQNTLWLVIPRDKLKDIIAIPRITFRWVRSDGITLSCIPRSDGSNLNAKLLSPRCFSLGCIVFLEWSFDSLYLSSCTTNRIFP